MALNYYANLAATADDDDDQTVLASNVTCYNSTSGTVATYIHHCRGVQGTGFVDGRVKACFRRGG